MMILPYRLSITAARLPVANWVLIAVTVVVFGFQIAGRESAAFLSDFILRDWDIAGMLGSVFLHGGIMHLLGNMLFLWVFGNAVCAAVGNFEFPLLYLFLGLCASAMHLAFSAGPAIGASGAINGVMGMSLILFPVSRLKCVYAFFLPFVLMKVGKFEIKAFWMITLWFVFDVFGILLGSGGVAYWAHLGGFGAGMVAGWLMIQFDRVAMFDPTLPDVIAGRADTEELEPDIKLENRLAAMTEQSLAPPAFADERNEIARKQGQDIHDLWTGGAFSPEDPQPGAAPIPEPPPAPDPVPQPITARPAPPRTASPALPTAPPASTPVTPRHMKLRMLRVQRSGDTLNCYFVNEGDEVGDLAVSADAGVTAEIYPVKLLKKRDSGWIRIAHLPSAGDVTLNMDVMFADAAGGQGHYNVSVQVPQRS